MINPHLFLQNLALVLGVAAVTTVLFQKLRQPVVLGYLLAGIVVGPHVPIPLIADSDIIHTLAELGMILLMFFIGLEFSIRKLVKLVPTAGFVALLQSSFMVWIGYIVGQLFGWSGEESLYAGAIIAISSTTIIAKAFEEEKIKGKLFDLVFGILIVEDLIAILLLTAFDTLSHNNQLKTDELIKAGLSLTYFLVVTLVAGIWIVPRLMKAIVRLNRPETTLITAIGLCFSMALVAQKFGYSVALGAFLAGALIAESGVEKTVEELVRPVRDMFGAIFFVAVGMLFDPALVVQHWVAVVVFVVVIVVGKLVGVSFGSFLVGFGTRTSLRAGMSLAQIGEFSFIIAGVGIATGATGQFLYAIAIAVSGITAFLTPLLIRVSDPLAQHLDRHLPHAFQTFASLYGSWINQIRTAKAPSSANSRFRHLLKLLLIDVGILIGFTISLSIFLDSLTDVTSAYTKTSPDIAKIGIIAIGVVLAGPFLLGIIRCAGGLGRVLATKALPSSQDSTLDLAAAPRKALVISLQLVIICMVGVPFLALTQPFIPLLVSISLFGFCLILIGVSFWRSAENLQGHIKAGAEVVIEALSSRLSNPEKENSPNVEKLLPGLGALQSLTLPETSPVIGKTLSELNLRGVTGATVIAITRSQGSTVVPSARERLQAKDVLTLMGTEEAFEEAQRILAIDHPSIE